jgi:outer membrane autotransporter protein
MIIHIIVSHRTVKKMSFKKIHFKKKRLAIALSAILFGTNVFAAPIEEVIDGKTVMITSPTSEETQYTINNGGGLTISDNVEVGFNQENAPSGTSHIVTDSFLSVQNNSTLNGNIAFGNANININKSTINGSLAQYNSGESGYFVATDSIINGTIDISSGSFILSNSTVSDYIKIVNAFFDIRGTEVTVDHAHSNDNLAVFLSSGASGVIQDSNITLNSDTIAGNTYAIYAPETQLTFADSTVKSNTLGMMTYKSTIDASRIDITSDQNSAVRNVDSDFYLVNSNITSSMTENTGQCGVDAALVAHCGAILMQGGKFEIDKTNVYSSNAGIVITPLGTVGINSNIILDDSHIHAENDVFRVENGAKATISITGTGIYNSLNPNYYSKEGSLLYAGGDSTVDLSIVKQRIDGDITADDSSTVNVSLSNMSSLIGNMFNVNKLTLSQNATWSLAHNNYVRDLNMLGGLIDLTRKQGAEKFNSLLVESLSGTGTFRFDTNLGEMQGAFLEVRGEATGAYQLSVANTGAEPEDIAARLKLVQTGGGLSYFDLINGKVDVGVWQYELIKDGNSWYLGNSYTEEENTPEIPDETPDTPDETPEVPGEKPETPDEAPEVPGEKPDTPDENPDNPGEVPEIPNDEPGNEGDQGDTEVPDTAPPASSSTSSTTDAILSLAYSPVFIFNNELEELRKRQYVGPNKTEDSAGMWIQYLNKKADIYGVMGSAYRLTQNGFLIGADKALQTNYGVVTLGAFTGISDAKLHHDRGGKSSVESKTAGLYAGLENSHGYYINAIFKANRFSTKLNARMTDDTPVHGSFNQNAIGGEVETGMNFMVQENLWLTPYARVSGLKADSRKFTASNGMSANIRSPRSLQMEGGLYAGTSIKINEVNIQPHLKFGLSREMIKNNEVTLNDRWDFNNRYDGTVRKTAAGVDVSVTNQSSLFADISHQKGRHVDTAIGGTVGFEVRF